MDKKEAGDFRIYQYSGSGSLEKWGDFNKIHKHKSMEEASKAIERFCAWKKSRQQPIYFEQLLIIQYSDKFRSRIVKIVENEKL